ncbi:probable disease resistance protein At5g45490 [Quercus lobata]|nr:probable disease resistance protein At5g45490 [Quercus lobata]
MDSPGSYRRSSRILPVTPVHGFDTELISLEKIVQQRQSSDQFKAVAIVGKRGVGKTTLCQVLFNKPEVKADFLPRIWVCMSWKPTEPGDRKTTTVKRMLTCLGVDDQIIQSISDSEPKADRLRRLLYALHLQLTGKKYLIVLDDAIEGDDAIKEGDDADKKKKKADAFKERNKWLADLDSPITEKEKWGECLAFGLPKGHGGTVIVTSRDEKLAKVMVGEKNLLHLLPLLDPKSCASIFNDHIKGEQKLKEDLEKKEFLKKCAGLPIAATMMGKIKSDELAKAAEKAANEAAEKAAKEAAEKAAKEPAKTMEQLHTESKPIQPDEAAKSSKDDKEIKPEEVPAGEKHIQQQEKDARSSIGSKDDEQIISEEHPAESEPRPQQEGATHN